jgi:hypothetical protein
MALLTDAEIVTLEDLQPYETNLVGVLTTYGIDANNKIGLATEAVSEQLLLHLLKSGLSDPQHAVRRLLGVSSVVFTNPLQRWLCMETLVQIYNEAYNVQLNDRFKGKWLQYLEQTAATRQLVWQLGVGVVFKPLPKPQAPLVGLQTGLLLNAELLIQVAWTDVDGNESALSPVAAILIPDQSSIAVSTTEGVSCAPPGAFGWNVYVAPAGSDPTRQNNAPIPIGSVWVSPDVGLTQGPAPRDGQQPDYYVFDQRRLSRG